MAKANLSTGIRSGDQYHNLAQKAEHDPTPSTAFDESHAPLDDESRDVIATLREHPAVIHPLAGSGEAEEVQLMGLYWMRRVDLRTLAKRLVELTAETDGRNAACAFQRFMVLGEARQLARQDITLFNGLELNCRLDTTELSLNCGLVGCKPKPQCGRPTDRFYKMQPDAPAFATCQATHRLASC